MNKIHAYHECIGSVTTEFDKHVDVDVNTVKGKVNLELTDNEFDIVSVSSYLSVEEARKVIADLQKAVDSLEGGK